VERHPFSDAGRRLVNEMLDLVAKEVSIIVPGVSKGGEPALADHEARVAALADLRERAIRMGSELPWEDRGAILALLGSAERAFYLVDRIHEERLSVPRVVTVTAPAQQDRPAGDFGQAAAVPAE
jgi:phosphate:Na+ symporter